MNRRHQHVLVIAIGVVIVVCVGMANALWVRPRNDLGWFNYSPDTGTTFSNHQVPALKKYAPPVVGFSAWVALSWLVYRVGERRAARRSARR